MSRSAEDRDMFHEEGGTATKRLQAVRPTLVLYLAHCPNPSVWPWSFSQAADGHGIWSGTYHATGCEMRLRVPLCHGLKHCQRSGPASQALTFEWPPCGRLVRIGAQYLEIMRLRPGFRANDHLLAKHKELPSVLHAAILVRFSDAERTSAPGQLQLFSEGIPLFRMRVSASRHMLG